jgi:hypothetical protein
MSGTLILMRGLPATGKSTRALELAGDDGVILSPDDFWYMIVNSANQSEFSFDYTRLKEAHIWNQARAESYMGRQGAKKIIIDSTNVTKREAYPYIWNAQRYGYVVRIEEPTSPQWKAMRLDLSMGLKSQEYLEACAVRLAEISKKTHNVPIEVIRRKIYQWEEFSVQGVLAMTPDLVG